MEEKKFSNRDAFQIWWFVTWRTIATIIVLSAIIAFLPLDFIMNRFPTVLPLTLSAIIQIFYFKMAVNRDYRGFRLQAEIKEKKVK